MKTIKNVILISLLCTYYSLLFSITINIPADQPTIQAGIDESVDGDTVLVQPGTYIENINFNGHNITLASLFFTTQDTSYISQTIIDGNQNGSVVTFENDEDNTTVLSGFTIANGNAIYNGGGIYILFAYPKLMNLIVKDNTSYNGGGIYIRYNNMGNSDLTNLKITNNVSSGDGGGIYCDAEIYCSNSIISGNHSLNKGGGIFIKNTSFAPIPALHTVKIDDNVAYNGAGLYIDNINDMELNFVSVRNNFAESKGGGFYIRDSELIFRTNNSCNVYGNESGSSYSKDIFVSDCEVEVIVDTFSINEPSVIQVYPLENITVNCQNFIEEAITTDVYVSQSGSNSNTGTSPDSPFQSLLYAISSIVNDPPEPININIENGTYLLENIQQTVSYPGKNNVSVIGENNEETIFVGYNSVNSTVQEIFDVRNIQNFTVKNMSLHHSYPNIVYAEDSEITLQNVKFTGNSNNVARVVYGINSDITMDNVLMSGNSTSQSGIYVRYDSHLTLNNCTLVNNESTVSGGMIGINNSTAEVFNTILWKNSPENFNLYGEQSELTVVNSNVKGGEDSVDDNGENIVHWLEGNIEEDPLFVGNDKRYPYSLSADSPCIDAGTNDTTDLNLPLWDIIGNERIWDGDEDGIAIIDMGSYEFGAPEYVKITDDVLQITSYELSNYPNPFNPVTTFSFNIPQDYKQAEIQIYNVKGRIVETLSFDSAQDDSIVWNADNYSSGVYFYKLQIDGKEKAVKKCLLLK